MKLLPVAARELRVSARRRELYVARTGAAALALVAAGLVLVALRGAPAPVQAQMLFPVLSGLALLYGLLCGLRATADCLSEEKREGTLGLLFLTDLRAFDIVAGKVLAGSLNSLAALLALLPALAIPLLLGGVPAGAVGRMALLLAVTTAFSLAAGVLVSALCRDAPRALGGTLALILLLMAGPSLLRLALYGLSDDPLPEVRAWLEPGLPPHLREFAWLHVPNPAAAFVDILAGAFGRGRLQMYWPAVLAVALAAAGCLAGALAALPRAWQDRPAAGRDRASRRGAAAERGGRAAALLPLPFAWIVTRQRRTVTVTWLGLAAMAAGWLWGLAELRGEWLEPPVALLTGWGVMAWVKSQLGAAACQPFHEQRRTGALELVLCTPQTPGDLLRGHVEGLRRQFQAPLAAAAAATAGLFLAGYLADPPAPDDAALFWALLVTGLFFLAFDVVTITAVGMWQGLSAPKLARALGQTHASVLVLPWLLWGGLMIGGAILGDLVGLSFLAGGDAAGWNLLALFVALNVAINGALLSGARQGLRTRFRELALEHYGPAPARPGWRFRRARATVNA
jgi:hypothetical protein